MKYYRIIFKTDEEGVCVFTEIVEQDMAQEYFQKMSWDKPIIRHEVNEHVHFISLERNFLEAMILGIKTLKDLEAETKPTISLLGTPQT